MKRFVTPALLLAALAVAPARAQEEEHGHVDALLIINPDNQLVTGGYDFEDNQLDNTLTRVYESEFDAFGTIDEPGFNALSSDNGQIPDGFSALPGNTDVTFTANAFALGGQTANLWHWNAEGAVAFNPVAAGTTLTISKAPAAVFSSVLDGSANDVQGFTIETTNATGFLHKHIDFTVNQPVAEEGFYLWSLTLEVGAYATEPVYFVHGLGDHDEALHEAAIDFVQANLVPEPTSAALLAGLGGLAMIRRRRA